MKIKFLGATQTVTGSKYLIEHNDVRILIDCGLFQGFKELRLRNWDRFPVDPKSIDYVILTHAHIDHSGYLPLLVKNGFRGKIYSSFGTYDLCKILLPDSGFLQEEDAARANKYGYTKHKPAMPLYSEEDAIKSLKYFRTVDCDKEIFLEPNLSFTLKNSGHILGSTFIILKYNNKTITFSGDLGRLNDPILQPPTKLENTDYLLIESTYGNRLHEKIDTSSEIAEIINSTIEKGGTILIPAFAVGRAQIMLYYIEKLKREKSIPDIPVFLDSPMAISATELFHKYRSELKLSEEVCVKICQAATYVRSVEESKKIDTSPMPKVIISASGMAVGGRILHHLKLFAPDHKNTILFTGFQAGGTRGDRIVRGEKAVKIHGQMVAINARVENLSSTSAHADYSEILEWLSNFKKAPQKIFITHGEEEAAESLKEKIIGKFGWNVKIPHYLESENLD